MPDGRDSDPVAFGRWFEAHQAIVERLSVLEREFRDVSPHSTHQRMTERITDLEEDVDNIRKTQQSREDRQWAIFRMLLTGLALPLAVSAVVTFIFTQIHLGQSWYSFWASS